MREGGIMPKIRLTMGGGKRVLTPGIGEVEYPKVLRKKIIFHRKQSDNSSTTYEFFTSVPSNWPIDGNFKEAYIKLNMEILGVGFDIYPYVKINAGSTEEGDLNKILEGTLELYIGENSIYQIKVRDLAPAIHITSGGATGSANYAVQPPQGWLFIDEMLPGMQIDKMTVKESMKVKTKLTIESALSGTSYYLRSFLIVRPLEETFVG